MNNTKEVKSTDEQGLYAERGMVSFMVTLIMIMVITLIIVGFSQITRRNQQAQRDRQLSSQAFYAAESGVNSAVRVIRSAPADQVAVKTTCTTATSDASPYTKGINPVLSNNPDIRYTCLLVNPLVSDLKTSATTKNSSVLMIDATDKDAGGSKPLTDLSIKWQSTEGDPLNGDPSGCTTQDKLGTFAKNSGGCGYGLLRVDLLMASGDGSSTTNANALNDNVRTIFLQPLASGGGNGAVDKKATVVGASCDKTKKQCSVRVSLPDMSGKYIYARFSSLYKNTPNIVVDGTYQGSGQDEAFFRGQIQIDSTGKAQDVLRRVQVRVPNESLFEPNSPVNALWSTSTICKQFTIVPPGGDSDHFKDNCPS